MMFSQEFIDDVALAFKRCNELQAENIIKSERIKELETDIAKRPAKPLFGEARSLLLKAMDNSACVGNAIEKYKRLQERIKELVVELQCKDCPAKTELPKGVIGCKAKERNRELEDYLREFGGHKTDCLAIETKNKIYCRCGYEQALKGELI